MNVSLFLKRNVFGIRVILILFGTLMFWHAFYFVEKQLSLDCISCYINDYRMYLALIFSFFTSVLTNNIFFNKKSIKRITSLNEKQVEKNLKLKSFVKFNSKGAYFVFMLFSVPTQIYLVFYLVYYKLLTFILKREVIFNNDLALYFSLFIGIVVSLCIHSYLGVFKIDETLKKNEKKNIK